MTKNKFNNEYFVEQMTRCRILPKRKKENTEGRKNSRRKSGKRERSGRRRRMSILSTLSTGPSLSLSKRKENLLL